MSDTDQANLSFLPPEVIRHICRYLNTEDILSLELTDRQQRQLIGESGVWRDLVLRWREYFTVKKCRMEETVNLLRKRFFSKKFKIYTSGLISQISQIKKILSVLDSDRYLLCKEETHAWKAYLSVVWRMMPQFITEENELFERFREEKELFYRFREM
eukprot:GFUD01097632.1.p1 GENE.GFUD01097632.1~~GFUD01097632.1.p1  ORF type:complete len:158 (-),score=17.14 GFUD01097632.1:52-525(-)